MPQKNSITVVIIDDETEAIAKLTQHLEIIPNVEIVGTATKYLKGIHLITEFKPDLLFLDIEMPCKNGFELLEEIEKRGLRNGLTVIFYTAYDKYTIQALRESAFDFILKPPASKEVNHTITRYRESRDKKPASESRPTEVTGKKMVALPTGTGLVFVPKAEIVYLESRKTDLGLRSAWSATLNNLQTIRLRQNTKANSIIGYLGDENFIQLSQSVIVNASYIKAIEYKTQSCLLFPPFDLIPLKISRQFLVELRERFDVI